MSLSGPGFCRLFPTSVSLDDLEPVFQSNCRAFIGALESAGAKVSISATFRPPQRAAMMHFSWMIAKAKMDPAAVPVIDGVDIQWNHGNPTETIEAASEMVKTYGIAYPPALVSRHSQRLAIDMTIDFNGKQILELPNQSIDVNQPSLLYATGARYGVIKLVSDQPHWSSDGH